MREKDSTRQCEEQLQRPVSQAFSPNSPFAQIAKGACHKAVMHAWLNVCAWCFLNSNGSKPLASRGRWSMLKTWMINDGNCDSIHVEERYVQWVEQLRTDRYVTVLGLQLMFLNVPFSPPKWFINLSWPLATYTIPGHQNAALQDIRQKQRG